MRDRRFLACAFILAFASPFIGLSYGQSRADSMTIGSAALSLGMPKDTALSVLGEHYTLKKFLPAGKPAASLEMWDFSEPKNPVPVGSVHFVDGKLTSVWRDWTFEDKTYTAAEISELTYRIAERFEADGNTQCSLRTSSSAPPPGPGHDEFRSTIIRCGHRTLEIMLVWGANGSANAQVYEGLSNE